MFLLRKLFFVLPVFALFFIANTVNAEETKTYSIERFDVDIKVNEDSTIDVTEKVTYNFTGEFSYVTRGLTLQDYENTRACQQNAFLQCGGFDAVNLVSSKFEGEEIDISDIDTFVTDNYYNRIFNIEYKFGPEDLDNEKRTWEITYKVYGSLGFFEYEGYSLFYWNMLPEMRDNDIQVSSMKIIYPDSNLLLTDYDISIQSTNIGYSLNNQKGVLDIQAQNVSAYQDFTVLIKFPIDLINQPGTIALQLKPTYMTVKYLDLEREMKSGDVILGLPSGEYDFEFKKFGYKDEKIKVNVGNGEDKKLEINLEKHLWLEVLGSLSIIINLIFACALPLTFLIVFRKWYKNGRDQGGKKTIIPWYKPPENIKPYLLGSLKDERVDMVDISSVLVDTAYRGFIKIKEIDKRKYEFIKLKDFDDLDHIEKKILSAVFDKKESVTTDDLKNRFYRHIYDIKNKIFDKMVSEKFFEKRPDSIRESNVAIGIVLIVLSIVGTIIMGSFGVGLLDYGVFLPCSFGVWLGVLGFFILIFSPFMPAKTPRGTIIYEKAQGFRMFLHTADRYRLAQNAPEVIKHLTPANFEKFLSYAMVFGVEKEWAKAFKDIYTSKPSWFESDSSTFDTIYLASSLSRLNTNTVKAMTTSPQSNGNWSSGSSAGGGGWSGGGGFSGGFSGGGGGGGSIGAR